MSVVMWFRRDLRRQDNPALNAAIAHAALTDSAVTPMVMIDDSMWPGWNQAKQYYLSQSLHDLNQNLDGTLVVRHGNPSEQVVEVARSVGATSVHIAADFTPEGMARDAAVEAELGKLGIQLVRTGSFYAISPGRVTKPDTTPYKVYTPFYKAWLAHGWRQPAEAVHTTKWNRTKLGHGIPAVQAPTHVQLPPAGESAALARFREFIANDVREYDTLRDRADLNRTSHLSVHLKWGEIHPRTILAELGDSNGEEIFRKEIAWREFYADVLFHNPHTLTEYLNPQFATMRYDTGTIAEQRFEAWKQGRTGFPFVDAGMRQLLNEGWMHNRVRMVVASFLVKDLHLEWQQGAAWFFEQLIDADLASNQHGWQWTAGCGTDASPYFRIFNPMSQGLKFDPSGDYVRRYIPELRHIEGSAVHEPWKCFDGYSHDYPAPIVDHAAERAESLARYAEMKNS